MTIADLHRVILPPVALQQYRLWEADGFPVGFMSWALFNEEAESWLSGRHTAYPGPMTGTAGDRLVAG
jgi:hemolysin-activating ACP:hemolysin acyltransferase